MKTINFYFRKHFILMAMACSFPFFVLAQQTNLDSLKNLLSITKDKKERLEIYHKIFDKIQLLQPKDILELGTEMLTLATELDDEGHIVDAHYNIAVGHYYMGKYNEAIAAALTSAQLLEHQDEPKKKGDAYSFIGVCYTKKGDYVRALENLQESHRVSMKINDEEGAATALGNIAQIYVDIGDNEKAKQTYFEVLKMFDAYGEQDFFKAVIYNNIGGYVMEQPDSAILWLEKARVIFEEVGDPGGIAYTNNGLGEQFLKKKEFAKALSHYEITKATWESETHHFSPGLVEVYTGMAQCYEGLENTAQADHFFDQAIALGEADSLNKNLPVAYLGKASILEQRGQHQEALRLTKAARQLEKELLNEAKAKELANSEIKYRTEEKEKELAQAELEIEKKARQNQQLLLGSILAILALFGVFQFWRNKTRLKRKEAELELSLRKAEAENLKELDSLKSTFFANISHEFRTPLTLILGPVQQALESVPASESIENVTEIPVKGRHLEVIRRNALRLQNLINQLLDLSKLDSGKMALQVSQGNLIQFIRSLVFSFESLAERKRIHFKTSFPPELPEAYFDKDKWEKILVNLLSNAFKFTPENGTIWVTVQEVNAGLRISIGDSGKGMDATETNKIFDRFYQVKTDSQAEASPGTGIGLSLVKELVELQRGQISVDSIRGEGTTFKLTLPFSHSAFHSDEIVSLPARSSPNIVTNSHRDWYSHIGSSFASNGMVASDESPNHLTIQPSDHPTLLIVEDNPDLRFFIAETMQGEYQIITAENGEVGLANAIERTPDLIISDVMMPKMDGFEMCETLKKDERTSHIPIILLTAKAGQRHKVEGLETGADDYLTKPFDEKELKVRARNLVEQRRQLREQFGKLTTLTPSEVAVTSTDQRFLEKVTTAIEENMDNEFFSVEDLASQVAFSRSQLHRKLKALTGKSPNELIRDFRLARAKELLEKGAGNVSEVAMEVGYSSVSYFTRSFKSAFGVSPSEV